MGSLYMSSIVSLVIVIAEATQKIPYIFCHKKKEPVKVKSVCENDLKKV